MEPALAAVCLAGGGEGAGPVLPVPGAHAAAHVTRALGEAVQLQLHSYIYRSHASIIRQQLEKDATKILKAKSNSLRIHVRMHLKQRFKSCPHLVHGLLLQGGVRAGGLDAVAGEVVVRRQRGVEREAGAHAAQPGLVVAR